MCVRRGYIRDNPTFGLGKIKADCPTDYFPADEFDRIIDSTYAYRENRGETGNTNSTRLRTMTLLMRWSGLRIRDSVTLEMSRLQADSLLLYQAEIGTPVYAPLPSHLIAALKDVPPGPKPNPRYFFWSGRALLPIGKGAIAVSSNWPTLRNQTALESAAIRICFATRSRWRCWLAACRSEEAPEYDRWGIHALFS